MLKRNENQYLYLLSCINLDGYNLLRPQENMSKRELISCLRDIAKKELQKNVLYQKDLTDWLSGLPSSINIDFSFIEIENKLLSFGFKKIDDKKINNWFNVMSFRLLQMFEALDNKKSWFYDNK